MKGLLVKAAVAGLGTLLVSGFAFAAVGNDHTGAESENNASVETHNSAKVTAHSDADIRNVINGMLGTGHNKADRNTGNGTVHSGDASADVDINNKANNSTVSITGTSMGVSMPSVTNSTTGAESENNAWVKTHNSLDIDVHNDGDVHNCVTVDNETGNNKASYNTGSGSVTSGDASLDFDLSTTLNTSSVTVH
jgi:hypothetical protein